MKREDRYLVLKISDIEAAEKELYITPEERRLLYHIAVTVQGVVDAPGVDAALRAFTEDATNDNAFFLVRAIMEACLPRAPESDADES